MIGGCFFLLDLLSAHRILEVLVYLMLGVRIRGVQEYLIYFYVLQGRVVLHLGVVPHVPSVQINLSVPLLIAFAFTHTDPLIYPIPILMIGFCCVEATTCFRVSHLKKKEHSAGAMVCIQECYIC